MGNCQCVCAGSHAETHVPCCSSCTVCSTFADGLAAFDSGAVGAPPAWPAAHLKTSVSPGADGLHAELVRWFSVDDTDGDASGGGTFAVRMRLCHGIAMALRKIADDGLPPELAVSLVFPLLKALKPGQVADRADPTAYRTLAVAGLLSKILSLLMLTRLTHFAEGTGALPWEQGSSRTGGQNAEQHALTLLSFLRARRRAGKWSYVLYVDVVKAFDRVHPAALDAVLLRMGVPAPMRTLLRVWRAGRLGAVVVNGVQSEPFPIGTGVPQGCPLSPLLFNLFLSSLSTYLASCTELRGAEALSVQLFRLIFADDVAIIAEEPAEIQAALTRIHVWMRAWGLDISVGPSKTEAQAFPPSHAAAALAAPLPALSTLDGRPVAWVQLYRYLGLSLSSDLTDTVQASRTVSAVRTAYARCFHRNEVVRSLPPGVQLQILRTYVLSASEYLSGVLTVRASVAAALDAVALDAVRGIFGLPRHTSSALLWGISGLVPSATLAQRAQLRILFQLLGTTTDSPASRVTRALAGEPHSPQSRAGPAPNWVHAAWRQRALWGGLGVAVPDAGLPAARAGRAARAAAVVEYQADLCAIALRARRRATDYACEAAAGGAADPSSAAALSLRLFAFDSAGAAVWQHIAAAALPASVAPPVLRYKPPPCAGSAVHAASVHQRPTCDGDSAADGAPLALMGPGCPSVLNSLMEAPRRLHALYAAWLGVEALSMFPFAPGAPRPPADRAARWPRGGPDGAAFAVRFVLRTCRLCGTEVESIHHLAFDCTHHALRAEREVTIAEVRLRAADVRKAVVSARHVVSARSGRGAAWAPPGGPEDDALLAFLDGGALDDGELAFLGYRLLLAAPFPAVVARRYGFLASASAARGRARPGRSPAVRILGSVG